MVANKEVQPNCFPLKGVPETQPSVIQKSNTGMSFTVSLPHGVQSLELNEF